MERTNLIKRCQLGDSESFGQLYRLYSHKALGTAYLISGRRGIAEDIVQEAFFQCFRKIKYLNNPELFDVWFYKMLVRIGWKMTSRQDNNSSYEEMNSDDSIPENSIGTSMEDRETKMVVHQVLEKLTVPLKTVVILYYFNDMSVKQISKVLDCFQGTVKSRLHNARKILQKELRGIMDENLGIICSGRECNING